MKEVPVKNKVKVTRIEKGEMTQIDLANLVGVTRQTMNLIEAQKYNPSIRICLLIARFLRKPLDELFWIDD